MPAVTLSVEGTGAERLVDVCVGMASWVMIRWF